MNKTSKITLRAARVNSGYTQTDVAFKLNVSPQTVSNWENYKTWPDALQIAKLCDLYGVDFQDLDFLNK